MIEGASVEILIIKPCEGEWYVVPSNRRSQIGGLVRLFGGEAARPAILALLAPLTDDHIRQIAAEHACIEYNKHRWGYDVRWVRPN